MRKVTKIVLGFAIIVVLVPLVLTVIQYRLYDHKSPVSDAELFASEYPWVSQENVFVYKTPAEILQILEKGRGVIYFGFSSCQRCQHYVPYLNQVAQKEGIDKIYYTDIKEERAQNSEIYQKIVDVLKEYLLDDEEGNPRIYVPDVTIVNKGAIIFHDNESSVVTEEDWTPDEYWTPSRVSALQERLSQAMKKLPRLCGEWCNE